ncbi:iron-sulfur cluster assembly scaffold protein [Candidatus Pacearchaeota archaeon]|nr:MAG: iron-sulfur cluster assembly scaffold protein [Candidatus Pacearchaeota archaeon]
MNKRYSKKVMQHFLHPKNIGKIKNPDGVGEIGNPVCGDIINVYIKVGKNKQGEKILKDVKFKTFGCAAAIASSSIITDLAKEKTLKEAKKITMKNISKSLKGLPPLKMHCSSMAEKALKKAIEEYEKKDSS